MKRQAPRELPRRGASASALPAPGSGDAAKAQLEAFLARYDPEIAALARKALALMRRRLPGAVELVYDSYNALAIGFSAAEKVSSTPLSIALYPRWITLFFLQGAMLWDPEGLLEGKGSSVRSIRIRNARALAATFANKDVDALIAGALLHVGWKLDLKAKGRVIIKSVSARQRPRRP